MVCLKLTRVVLLDLSPLLVGIGTVEIDVRVGGLNFTGNVHLDTLVGGDGDVSSTSHLIVSGLDRG